MNRILYIILSSLFLFVNVSADTFTVALKKAYNNI